MTTIGKARIVITADHSTVKSSANAAGREAGDSLTKGFSSASGGLKSAGSRAMSAVGKTMKAGAVAVGGAIAAGLAVTLTKGFQRLQAIDQAQAKMRGLGYEGKNLEGIMDSALNSVKGTAFGLGDAANAAANALNAGVKPGEQLDRTLKAVVGSAAASGASMVDLQGVFNKAATAGAANNEVLGMLQERGIPIVKQLAKDLGVSESEIANLARTGEISFDQLIDSAGAASGTIAEEMGKTLAGRLSNAWAAIGRLGASLLGGEDGKGGIFAQLGPLIGSLTDKIDTLGPVAERIGERVGAAFAKILEGGQALYDLVVKGDFTSAFREAFNVEEDHPFVGFLFTVREYAVAVFDYFRNTAIPTLMDLVDGFRNNEGAGGKLREIFDQIWGVAKSVFGWFRDEALPVLVDMGKFIIGTLWPDLKKAFIDNIIPALREVGRVAMIMWKDFFQPALKAIWAFIRDILWPFIKDFYENGIKPTFKLIGQAIEFAWNKVIKPTFSALKEGGTQVKDRFVTVKDGIKLAWDRVSSIVSGGWDKIKGIFDRFKSGLNSLKDRFGKVKDGIATTWSKLVSAVATPINGVIDKINDFLSKVKSGLNKIPGVKITGDWSIAKISTGSSSAGGGAARPVQALADGGRVAGNSAHSRADDIMAWLTSDEEVIRQASARRMRRERPGWLEHINRYGRPPEPTDAGGGIRDTARRWFGSGVEALQNILSNARDWVTGLFSRIMPDFGSSWAGQAALGAAGSVKQALADWLKGKAQEASSAASPTGSGISWGYGLRKLFAKPDFHTGLDFRAAMNTAVRAAAAGRVVTGSGWDNAGGRYVALAHPDGVHSGYFHLARSLVSAGEQVAKGQKIALSGNSGSMTTGPHLHFQTGRGSIWNHFDPRTWLKGMVADGGAVLSPGINVLDNRTGGPEPLMRTDRQIDLTPDTIQQLVRALAPYLGLNVTIDVDDLEGLRTLDDFLTMINVRAGMVRAGG